MNLDISNKFYLGLVVLASPGQAPIMPFQATVIGYRNNNIVVKDHAGKTWECAESELEIIED